VEENQNIFPFVKLLKLNQNKVSQELYISLHILLILPPPTYRRRELAIMPFVIKGLVNGISQFFIFTFFMEVLATVMLSGKIKIIYI
jgi:hypothetical protein